MSAGLWLAAWPKEKPTCSVSRLSTSWASVTNPRSLHQSPSQLPSVSFLLFYIQACLNGEQQWRSFYISIAPPSAPYDISLLSCDGHSMLLTWKKPLLSGGSSIKEYYVDKRRSGTTVWREIHIPPISERVYKVHKSSHFLSDFAHLAKHSRDNLVWKTQK